MAGSGRKLADDLLAAEMAAGKTMQDAAKAAGVAERTAYRRLINPAFKARVSELRGAMVATPAGRLADGMGEAAGVRLHPLAGRTTVICLHRGASEVAVALNHPDMIFRQRKIAIISTLTTGRQFD